MRGSLPERYTREYFSPGKINGSEETVCTAKPPVSPFSDEKAAVFRKSAVMGVTYKLVKTYCGLENERGYN